MEEDAKAWGEQDFPRSPGIRLGEQTDWPVTLWLLVVGEGLTQFPHACSNLPGGFSYLNLGSHGRVVINSCVTAGKFHSLGLNFLIYKIMVLGSRPRVRPRPGSHGLMNMICPPIPT